MDVRLLRKFGIDWAYDVDGKIVVRDELSVLEIQLLSDLSQGSVPVTKEEVVVESDRRHPRAGRTKMPKRLVHSKVLFDLGYPFYEVSSLILKEMVLANGSRRMS